MFTYLLSCREMRVPAGRSFLNRWCFAALIAAWAGNVHGNTLLITVALCDCSICPLKSNTETIISMSQLLQKKKKKKKSNVPRVNMWKLSCLFYPCTHFVAAQFTLTSELRFQLLVKYLRFAEGGWFQVLCQRFLFCFVFCFLMVQIANSCILFCFYTKSQRLIIL